MRRTLVILGAVLALAGCGSQKRRSASTSSAQAAQQQQMPQLQATSPVAGPHPARRSRTPKRRPAARRASHKRTAAPARNATPSARRRRTGTRSAPQAPPVTLSLHGGGDRSLSACGAVHHYRTYAPGAAIRFSGTVHPTPSGHWKVKLKIKVCRRGGFVDYTKLDATRDKHGGTFSGSFRAPPAGRYSLRAVLYVNGSERASSGKRHFET